MLASRRFLACCSFLLQGAPIPGQASPLLAERGNSYHLKCTNAPKVVAGYFLDPRDAIPASSASATCQAQYEYLYCVPGTKTYLFFGVLTPTLQPNTSQYAATLASTISYIDAHIAASPTGDGIIDGGLEYFRTTPSTGVEIYVEDANKHHLTYGVAAAALRGLDAWMGDDDDRNGYADATFQINDGSNWVGNGYMGALNPQGVCQFAGAFVPNTTCQTTDEGDVVYGYDGGRLC